MPPDAGVMPCAERARGSCPYRGALGCSDADRAEGIERGRCVLELERRDELLRFALRDVEWLRPRDRPYFASLAARWAAARVYRERALMWLSVVTATHVRDASTWEGATALRTASRYWASGEALTSRVFRRMWPLIKEASHMKAGGWVAKGHAEALRRMKELDPSFGEPMKLGDPRFRRSGPGATPGQPQAGTVVSPVEKTA